METETPENLNKKRKDLLQELGPTTKPTEKLEAACRAVMESLRKYQSGSLGAQLGFCVQVFCQCLGMITYVTAGSEGKEKSLRYIVEYLENLYAALDKDQENRT